MKRPASWKPKNRVHAAALGACAGAGVVLAELLMPGHALDMPSTTLEALGVTMGLFGLLAAVDLRLTLALWPLLAWTEGAHASGGSPLWWTLPALPFVAVAWRTPRVALWLAPLMGLVVPLSRDGVSQESDGRGGDGRLLLITVDTVRADAGLLTQAIAPSPEWTLTTATSAAPWTPPAMTSLWLSLPVSDHGGGIELDGRITWPSGAGFQQGLTQRCADADNTVEAVVSNPYLRSEAGFGHGVDAFWHASDAREPHLLLHTLRSTAARLTDQDTRLAHTRDARVVALAEQRLTKHAPDVLWVHLLEPHEYRKRPGTAPQAYAAAVSKTAVHLRRLIKAAGDRTIVIVGDHGENLGEQGIWGHGRHLTGEVLEVPLAVRWTQASPLDGPWTLPRVGALLQHVCTQDGTVPAPSNPVAIGGLRGPDALRKWQWSPDTRTVEAQPGEVVPGPLQPPPSAAIHAALQALGYEDR